MRYKNEIQDWGYAVTAIEIVTRAAGTISNCG